MRRTDSGCDRAKEWFHFSIPIDETRSLDRVKADRPDIEQWILRKRLVTVEIEIQEDFVKGWPICSKIALIGFTRLPISFSSKFVAPNKAVFLNRDRVKICIFPNPHVLNWVFLYFSSSPPPMIYGLAKKAQWWMEANIFHKKKIGTLTDAGATSHSN